MCKEHLYNEYGQWTDAGKKLSRKINIEFDALIGKYVGQFNRVEFDHFLQHHLSSRMSLHFLKNHTWPTQE